MTNQEPPSRSAYFPTNEELAEMSPRERWEVCDSADKAYSYACKMFAESTATETDIWGNPVAASSDQI